MCATPRYRHDRNPGDLSGSAVYRTEESRRAARESRKLLRRAKEASIAAEREAQEDEGLLRRKERGPASGIPLSLKDPSISRHPVDSPTGAWPWLHLGCSSGLG